MNKSELKQRGWTEALINRFIPNAQKCNGRYSFCMNEIEQIESTLTFRSEMAKVERIRARYKALTEYARQARELVLQRMTQQHNTV